MTLAANWLVKPFTMALLGWFFIGWLFRPYLPAEQIESYIAGLILLGAAPCTAMVFVWSNLTKGEPHFTLSQVALNDLIMVFAFAPIVALLLGLSAIVVPWDTLLLSVGPLHRGSGHRCPRRPAAGRYRTADTALSTGCCSSLQPPVNYGSACHARSSVCIPGRANPRPATYHCAVGGTNHHPDLFHLWFGYLLNRTLGKRTASRRHRL